MSSNVVYAVETVDQVKEEIGPLLLQHWQEVAVHKDKIHLSIDWDSYIKLHSTGNLLVVTARQDGELIGYFVVIINYHLHYKNNMYAVNDVIYIKPNKRAGYLARNMIKFAEEVLKERGVHVLVINTKVNHPFDNLLKKHGFDLTERIYSKYIGKI